MKTTIPLLVLLLLLIGCEAKSSNDFVMPQKNLSCKQTSDCICGGGKLGEGWFCFFGNRGTYEKYYDPSIDCSHYCGTDTNSYVIECANNECQLIANAEKLWKNQEKTI